ncbi:regulatory iron-sulfur-containing complex subunit RicT [Lishizhenia sp.]|uniref:regulatory iron-sulfur-containing complex subunit RicT n=1 Tax=Lishizhenia sp. TaxID=2497594 RepID=UPI00299F46C3|nr:regulatory iron-sulfur-containing complex subunit RicT [Lishizhenia sp.]MDX1444575.1 regulatory iron-sulfur-containing complex subunit RicT [Lishizhenia sp.]
MGCSSCSSGGGTPRGCQNNGTCSSGGCNKLGVFNWLANMQLPAGQSQYDIIEVRFKNSRKGFYRNVKDLSLQVGDVVVVEGSPGFDIGVVSIVGELTRIQVQKKAPNMKAHEAKKIYRIANQEDIDKWMEARNLEKEVMHQARELAINLNLEMKISDVEYQGDLTKATFYYTADQRVDFRQLIKDMAEAFKIRIEMRQIGARQEAARLGGIGSCGRELCCSTWLTDFRSVSTSAARYQQLSLNPQKLAGQCGKLKCCLNYELDMYLDSIKKFPKPDTRLYTEKGSAIHVKTDVFKRLMWYAYEGEAGVGSGLIPLSPERVEEIVELNKKREKPADLKDFEEQIKVEPDYSNVVGQDDLDRFEHVFKRRKKKRKKPGGRPAAKKAEAQKTSNKPAAKQEAKAEGNKPKPTRKPRPQNAKGKPRKPKPQNAAKNTQNPKEVKGGNKPKPKGPKPEQKAKTEKKPVKGPKAEGQPKAAPKKNFKKRKPRPQGGNKPQAKKDGE